MVSTLSLNFRFRRKQQPAIVLLVRRDGRCQGRRGVMRSVQRGHGNDRVADPDGRLTLMPGLSPVGNRERRPPASRSQLGGSPVAIGRESMPAALDLNDEQWLEPRLMLGSVPDAAQREADLPRRRARALDAVNL